MGILFRLYRHKSSDWYAFWIKKNSVTIPSLFHLVRKDFGSKFVDQSDQINSKTFKHILKWTDSEIAEIDHNREIRKLRLVFI